MNKLTKQDGYNFQKGIIKANIIQGILWLAISLITTFIIIIGLSIGGIL